MEQLLGEKNSKKHKGCDKCTMRTNPLKMIFFLEIMFFLNCVADFLRLLLEDKQRFKH